ncbi:MAG TPA: hypothetical protein VFK62_06015 [Gaiellaceae bacterium]|nr:hypothetical protein [Gaiellaceae bacterium]
MTRLAILAGALVLVAAGCGSGAGDLQPARFPARAGWNVGAGHVHACTDMARDRCAQAGSWATTGDWRDCTECLPQRTAAALPADGIAMTLVVGRGPNAPKQKLRWPPTLQPGDAKRLEGLPARTGVIQRAGLVHGFTTYVFVFFGRPRPTSAQLARARAELARVELP